MLGPTLQKIFAPSGNNTNSFPKHSMFFAQETVDYQLNLWRDENIFQTTSGYAYVLNLPDAGCVTPGFLTTDMVGIIRPEDYSLENFMKFISIRDDLNYLDPRCLPLDNSHLICIRFGRNVDQGRPGFIALRRDSNGLWSYKPLSPKGGCAQIDIPLQIDCNGAPIECPVKACLGKYTEFGGFYALKYDGTLFHQRVNLPNACDIIRHIQPTNISPVEVRGQGLPKREIYHAPMA